MANVNRPQKVATVTFMSVLSGLRIDLSQRFAVGARGIGPAEIGRMVDADPAADRNGCRKSSRAGRLCHCPLA
jgi:hypothetical protein